MSLSIFILSVSICVMQGSLGDLPWAEGTFSCIKIKFLSVYLYLSTCNLKQHTLTLMVPQAPWSVCLSVSHTRAWHHRYHDQSRQEAIEYRK